MKEEKLWWLSSWVVFKGAEGGIILLEWKLSDSIYELIDGFNGWAIILLGRSDGCSMNDGYEDWESGRGEKDGSVRGMMFSMQED